MGRLKPDTQYVYENAGGKIYAREVGQTERILVGYDSELTKNILEEQENDLLWREIRMTAKTNNTLQNALEEVIILYKLIKEHEDKSIFHHPV